MMNLRLRAGAFSLAIGLAAGACKSGDDGSSALDSAPGEAVARMDKDACAAVKERTMAAMRGGTAFDPASTFARELARERSVREELNVRAKACREGGQRVSGAARDAAACENLASQDQSAWERSLDALSRCSLSAEETQALVAADKEPAAPGACADADRPSFVDAQCRVSWDKLLDAIEARTGDVCDMMAGVASDKIANVPENVRSTCGHDLVKSVCAFYAKPAQASSGESGGAPLSLRQRVTDYYGAVSGESVIENFRHSVGQCFEAVTAGRLHAAARVGIRNLAKEVFENQILEKRKSWALSLATAACQTARQDVADSISATRNVDYENACGIKAFFTKDRLAACVKTAESVCVASTGHVNIAEALGAVPDGEILAYLNNVASGRIEDACKAGGTVARVSCGAIQQSIAQIRQAMRTGNNDWASCTGTTQMGACAGTLIAKKMSGGFTNNNGVAQADPKTGRRPCCWCYRDTYEDVPFGRDRALTRENWFGVIQDGDVASGNCAYMQNKGKQYGALPQYSANGKRVYWRYSDCGRVEVKGASCAADKDGRMYVWMPKENSFSAPVSVPNARPFSP